MQINYYILRDIFILNQVLRKIIKNDNTIIYDREYINFFIDNLLFYYINTIEYTIDDIKNKTIFL